MIETGKYLTKIVYDALCMVFREKDIEPDFTADFLTAENSPRAEFGDIAFPMFAFAKKLRTSPAKIAEAVSSKIGNNETAEIFTAGPYINFKMNRSSASEKILGKVSAEKENYGRNDSLKGKKIVVEFSCPNTNKPLHLGHLRNDSIGESVSRIFSFNNADVKKVNLINNRGIHICKSMAAYMKFGNGKTPESEHVKGDHFVGDYYVKYNMWEKEDPSAEAAARELLVKWENGDSETKKLWCLMNGWTMSGIEETYKKTGVSFDKIYYESDTYLYGKKVVLDGLEKGFFYKDENNTVWADLEEIGLDKKVLLRGDGTSLYLTQDIGTAIARHEDMPFDRLFYVVGSEQQYHFKVLFYILKKLGFEWADSLFHLSYGMVNLPDGKMKSREGKIVDADDLIADLEKIAKNEIIAKGRENKIDDMESAAVSIALGALNYFLLSTLPGKDMIFNPAESISFTGNTGPYLQYTGARISSMLKKYGADVSSDVDFSLISNDEEWEIIKLIGTFPETVELAGKEYNPMLIAVYLYELAKCYSKYYHDYPVLKNEKELSKARVFLSKSVLQVLKNGFSLIGIPYMEAM